MAPQPWNPQRINALSHGYWSSFALHAAVELGVTARLAGGPADAAGLARELGVDPRALEMLLRALCALELLVREGDSYALEPSAREFLVPGGPRDLSSVIRHQVDLVPDWARLPQGIRQGKAVAGKWSDQRRRHFYLAMRDLARQQAPGHPQAHLVRRLDGDYTEDPLGGPYDVVWISQVLHGEGPQTCRLLLAKAAAALNPGGTLWVQEFVVEPGGHPFPALFSLNMLLLTREGQSYSKDELTRFLTGAGLEEVEYLGPTQEGGPASLMRARKP